MGNPQEIIISVVVPVYNSSKTIRKCIRSITNQTYEKFQLILVNDGSIDKSLDICNEFAKKDSRIKVINKKNQGSIKARKTGIENSTGDYITFVDSDDWIDKNTLMILNEEINKNESDVIVFNSYRTLGKLNIIKRENKSRYFEGKNIFINEEIKNELASAYLYGHPFPAGLCGKIYKRDYLIQSGKYLDKIKFLGDDLYYNLEIFLKVKKVSIINKPLYFYRFGGNTSKYMPYLFNDIVNGYEIQKEVIEEYYKDTKEYQYKGISIMLLNTLKTSLYNLFLSSMNEKEIKEKISFYIKDKSIIEALDNDGSKEYFPEGFLNSIKNKEIDTLFDYGREQYQKSKVKKVILKIIS